MIKNIFLQRRQGTATGTAATAGSAPEVTTIVQSDNPSLESSDASTDSDLQRLSTPIVVTESTSASNGILVVTSATISASVSPTTNPNEFAPNETAVVEFSTTNLLGSSPISTSLATPSSTSIVDQPSNSDLDERISSNGLSNGAIAGIAVGAAFAVAIAAILAFFCYRKRHRCRGQTTEPQQTQYLSNDELLERDGNFYSEPQPASEAATEKYMSVLSTSGVSRHRGREAMRPQQADDTTVFSRFSTLYDQIELHVENFYQDSSPVIPPQVEGALSRYDTPYLGGPLAAILEESPRAITILKHILAYEITTATITPVLGSGKRSLLPTDIATTLLAVQSERQASGLPGGPTQNYQRLKSLAHNYRAYPSSLSTSSANESALQISRILSLWAEPKYDDHWRAQHLTEVMNGAVTFAIWLLSHPEQFDLWWDRFQAEGHRSLVTVPGLAKVTNYGGRVVEMATVLSDPISRRV